MVDRGAGEGCRVIISKRADDDIDDWYKKEAAEEDRQNGVHDSDWYKQQADTSERMNDEHLRKHARNWQSFDEALAENMRKSYAAEARGDEAGELDSPPEPDVSSVGVPAKHRPISFDTVDGTHLKFPNERSLAVWLAAQERIRKSATPEEPTMSLDLSAVVKAHGIGALCRHFVKSQSSFGVDEHQLVQLATEDAQRRYPTDTSGMAFAKLYEEGDELRAAIELAKSAAFEDAVTAEIEKDARDACAELAEIGKARWPSLSPSQRFARAFETASPDLQRRAHRRPGPSTSFPNPVAKMPLVNVDSVTLTPQSVTETNVDDPEKALAQLKALGRQKWPSLSETQSFLNAVTDPENAPLVRAALHRPTGSSPPRQ